jgi:hypothetical protein
MGLLVGLTLTDLERFDDGEITGNRCSQGNPHGEERHLARLEP